MGVTYLSYNKKNKLIKTEFLVITRFSISVPFRKFYLVPYPPHMIFCVCSPIQLIKNIRFCLKGYILQYSYQLPKLRSDVGILKKSNYSNSLFGHFKNIMK